MNQNTKMLIGAVIAAALAIAVYYGAISQQQATGIQGQANQALGTGSVTQQPNGPASQTQAAPVPVPTTPPTPSTTQGQR